jgi:hypothetical protein
MHDKCRYRDDAVGKKKVIVDSKIETQLIIACFEKLIPERKAGEYTEEQKAPAKRPTFAIKNEHIPCQTSETKLEDEDKEQRAQAGLARGADVDEYYKKC